MPPKKACKSQQCILCTQKIVEGKEQVLFCTGRCQGLIHRYCAGVSEAQFHALNEQSRPQGEQSTQSTQTTTSTKSFLCLVCTKQVHKDEIGELKNIVCTLKAEVQELRDKLQKLTVAGAKETAQNRAMLDKTYAAASRNAGVNEVRERASGGRRGGRSGRGGRGGRGGSNSSGRGNVVNDGIGGGKGEGQHGGSGDRVGGATESTKHREVVNGARRIWGTLRSASAHIVKSTIVKVSKISDDNNLQVKRKYKTLQNGRCKWWFVIHDSEEAMQDLEAKWESVRLQTGWCLERCTKPVNQCPIANSIVSNTDASIDPSPDCPMTITSPTLNPHVCDNSIVPSVAPQVPQEFHSASHKVPSHDSQENIISPLESAPQGSTMEGEGCLQVH